MGSQHCLVTSPLLDRLILPLFPVLRLILMYGEGILHLHPLSLYPLQLLLYSGSF